MAVLALSWPRFQASFRFLPVDIALQRYYADQKIPTDRLPVLVGFAGQAIARNDHYRYRDGLSVLHYLRALDPYTPALQRRPAYRLAETEAMASLRQARRQRGEPRVIRRRRRIRFSSESFFIFWSVRTVSGAVFSSTNW